MMTMQHIYTGKVGLRFDIEKTKIMACSPITSWQIDGETVGTVADFTFLGSKITADGDCSHEIKRCLLLERKVMTNLAVATAKLLLCPTLCDPRDGSPPGSPVPEILQARILEWAAFPSPWDLPNPGIKPGSPALQADSLLSELPGNLIVFCLPSFRCLTYQFI